MSGTPIRQRHLSIRDFDDIRLYLMFIAPDRSYCSLSQNHTDSNWVNALTLH